jgi:hypothetical protein
MCGGVRGWNETLSGIVEKDAPDWRHSSRPLLTWSMLSQMLIYARVSDHVRQQWHEAGLLDIVRHRQLTFGPALMRGGRLPDRVAGFSCVSGRGSPLRTPE